MTDKAQRQKARDANRARERVVLETMALAVRTACDSHEAGRQKDVNEALDRLVNYLGRLRRSRGLQKADTLEDVLVSCRIGEMAFTHKRNSVGIEGEFDLSELSKHLIW